MKERRGGEQAGEGGEVGARRGVQVGLKTGGAKGEVFASSSRQLPATLNSLCGSNIYASHEPAFGSRRR